MMNLPPSVKISIASAPTDMRKSFNGLLLQVQQVLKDEPYSGHLFVFFNKRRDQVRIFFWDRNGFSILAKRLERGCFKLPLTPPDATCVDVEASELALILEGIDLHKSSCRPRWEPAIKKAA
jgi:transposase